jgi:hypothetical protein
MEMMHVSVFIYGKLEVQVNKTYIYANSPSQNKIKQYQYTARELECCPIGKPVYCFSYYSVRGIDFSAFHMLPPTLLSSVSSFSTDPTFHSTLRSLSHRQENVSATEA